MRKKNYSVLWGCAMFFIGLLLCSAPVAGANNRQSNINYPSFMQGIDYGKGVTYVVGHNPPDSDSVCTAIAYASLKRQLGVNAEARIASLPNAETTYALNYFGVRKPLLLDDASGKNIILVDHNSFAQAVKGMEKANVLEIIDHHNLIGDVKTSAPVYYRNMPVVAGMMLSAILSDTDNLQSSTTTDLDRQAVADLEKKAGIQNRNAYFLAMEEELAAYKDMSDQEIFYSDYKEFTINGISYGCATVVALTPEKRIALEKRLGDWIAKNYASQKMDMLFLKIHDLETYAATISCYGDGALECAVHVLGKADANRIALDKKKYRKKVVRLLQPQIANWAANKAKNKAA